MYEENRRFSWTNLFIKVIIVVIFILFTVWLLSLSNRHLSNSVDVLTDNVFSDNIEKMKEVGKSYFTTERLPGKVGELKTLTLDRMYEKKLILKLRDKNGNACSAPNSYVSVEKLENEYEMKVYLECGNESDYIIVKMGCYSYCDSDICEKKEPEEKATSLEYQYKKTTGGYWTNWSNWTNWSKSNVSKTKYRDIDTKTVKEDYTYDKEITDIKIVGDATCPSVSGYKLVSNDNDVCIYSNSSSYEKNPTCPDLSGYTFIGRNGFTCNYSKGNVKVEDPTCPSVSGYTYIGRDDFTCNYSKTNYGNTVDLICPSVSGYTNTGISGTTCNYISVTTDTVEPTCPSLSGYTYTGRDDFTCNYSTRDGGDTVSPTCPSLSGYTYTGRNGFTCNYSSNSSSTDYKDPICPSLSGYTYTGRNGFTCNYSKQTKSSNYTLTYYGTGSGSYVPKDTNTYHYVQTSADYKYQCNNTCAYGWYYTYTIYKKNYSTTTETTTAKASCPQYYSQSGNRCAKTTSTSSTKTAKATCPSGYSESGSNCVSKSTTSYTTKRATCPYGYANNGKGKCVSISTDKITKPATCPSGYSKSGNECVSKSTTSYTTREATCKSGYIKSNGKCLTDTTVSTTKTATCPDGYDRSGNKCVKEIADTIKRDLTCANNESIKEGKCYVTTTTTVKNVGKKDVTYYRYRTRKYVNGKTTYMWSDSNNDASLIKAGYKLTGKTREKEVSVKGESK